MRILVVNAGSSSLKLRLLGNGDEVLASHDLPPPEVTWEASSMLRAAIAELGAVDAVGHRVVHGGTELVAPTTIDPGVLDRIRALTELAPLHQAKSIAGIEAVASALPGVPQVACFDTAFHATLTAAAVTYALPAQWRERRPLRRFGFHGLSHAYMARRAAELLDRSEQGFRVVTCHLGAGASLAAVVDGRSVDTTMGFTPLEGLVMATRSGDVDPGLLLWLQNQAGFAPETIADGLERRSGLLGLAGSGDMREVLVAEAQGSADATLAIAVYVHRLAKGIASMTASLGGLDALAFSGGVGENAASIRARAVERLGFLGLGLERDANERGSGDREIGAPGAAAATLVIESREDLEIARQVRMVLPEGGR